jgi:gluconokinase
VGRRLAGVLGGEFFDADAYHPAANVAKMSAGIPLTDDDRRPWFERLAREVIAPCPEGATCVLACSALKKTYRDWLRAARPGAVRFVHLDGSFELIYGRMAARKDHFMRADMLRSQFATLEHPADHGEDDVLSVGIEPPVDEVVRLVVSRLPGLDHGPVVTSSPGA